MSDTLETLTARLTALEKWRESTETRLSFIEALDDRVDGHDKDIQSIRDDVRNLRREVHLMHTDLGRVADSQTTHGLVLEKVYASQEKMIALLTKYVETDETTKG